MSHVGAVIWICSGFCQNPGRCHWYQPSFDFIHTDEYVWVIRRFRVQYLMLWAFSKATKLHEPVGLLEQGESCDYLWLIYTKKHHRKSRGDKILKACACHLYTTLHSCYMRMYSFSTTQVCVIFSCTFSALQLLWIMKYTILSTLRRSSVYKNKKPTKTKDKDWSKQSKINETK